MLRAAVILLLIALFPSHARAEARIALLVGNSDAGSLLVEIGQPDHVIKGFHCFLASWTIRTITRLTYHRAPI
jgi:hypothetical protein